MKLLNLLILILAITSLPIKSMAFSMDLDTVYLSDTFSHSSELTQTYTFYDIGFLLNLTKKGNIQVGWNYASQSINTSGSTTNDYSITEMGPKFAWYMDKDRSWSLVLVYNLIVTSDFKDSETLEWRGSSYKGAIGYTPKLTDNFSAGIRLNYHTASFNEEKEGSSTLNTISYSRALIYPTFTFVYNFSGD